MPSVMSASIWVRTATYEQALQKSSSRIVKAWMEKNLQANRKKSKRSRALVTDNYKNKTTYLENLQGSALSVVTRQETRKYTLTTRGRGTE